MCPSYKMELRVRGGSSNESAGRLEVAGFLIGERKMKRYIAIYQSDY